MARRTTEDRAAARSDIGRVREENQDRAYVGERRGRLLLAVADGVGGVAGGAVASTAAIDAVVHGFFGDAREARGGGGAASALAAAYARANAAVVDAAHDHGVPGAATTLVAAAVSGRQAAIANIGDSRAYLVRAGVARQLTTDHSGEFAGSITRFLGDPRGIQPDVFVETLMAGDRLVLCSDGLTRHVRPEEIGAIATRGAPGPAAERLVALANDRGGEDNVTVVVCRDRPRRRGAGAPVLAALVGIALGLGTLAAFGDRSVFGAPLRYVPPAPATSSTATAAATRAASASPAASPETSPSPSAVP